MRSSHKSDVRPVPPCTICRPGCSNSTDTVAAMTRNDSGSGKSEVAARGQAAGSRRPGSVWRRRAYRLAIGLLLLALDLWALSGFVLGRIGHWLTIQDPLVNADAIFVHNGHFPFRGIEAATLFHDGWAPEIWLMRRAPGKTERLLDDLGLSYETQADRNRELLNRLGVPLDSIKTIDPDGLNTSDEISAILGNLEATGLESVILVTSEQHTRRVRATWRHVAGPGYRAAVRHPAEDPFDPSSWWKTTTGVMNVTREILGIINLWAGLPLRPQEEADLRLPTRRP